MHNLGEIIAWGGGTVVLAVGAFFLLRGPLGWKVAGIIAAGIFAFGAYQTQIKRAERRGASENEERQRQRNLELEARVREAGLKELERQRETGGVINENDPNLRD